MNIKQNIFELGKEIQLANLATITEDGKPWVRYVLGMLDKDLNFRVSVQLSSRKVKQIKKNPHVHVTLGVTDITKVNQWVQIQGVADISTDKSERHAKQIQASIVSNTILLSDNLIYFRCTT